MITVNQAEKEVLKMQGSIQKTIEYKSIYFIIFSSFLLVVCLKSLAVKLVHPLTTSADQQRESPLAQARSAADSSVPYIFKR